MDRSPTWRGSPGRVDPAGLRPPACHSTSHGPAIVLAGHRTGDELHEIDGEVLGSREVFIAREQAKREIRVLGEMLTLPVVVRAHDRTLPVAVIPGLRATPGLPASLNTRFRRFCGPSQSGL